MMASENRDLNPVRIAVVLVLLNGEAVLVVQERCVLSSSRSFSYSLADASSQLAL